MMQPYTFNDDVLAIKRTTNDYMTNGIHAQKAVGAVLQLFHYAGLLTPPEARKLLESAAQQAVDEAESVRNNILRLSETWETWTQPDLPEDFSYDALAEDIISVNQQVAD